MPGSPRFLPSVNNLATSLLLGDLKHYTEKTTITV